MNSDTNTFEQTTFKEESHDIEVKFPLCPEEVIIKEDASENLQSEDDSETIFSPKLDQIIKQENTIGTDAVIKSEVNEFNLKTEVQPDIEKVFIKQEVDNDTEEIIESVNPEAASFECLNENNGRKLYKCSFCNFSGASIYSLKRHIKRIHSENKLYECSACSYSCSRVDNLTRHLLAKHVEKGLECRICNYTATDRGTLKAHMYAHKSDNRYKCTKCMYSSKEAHKLQIHEEQHTLFKCDQCTFRGQSKTHLQNHKKKHLVEQHICKLCYFCTPKEVEFKKHMAMHTSGRKQYRCDKCSFSDTNIALLNAHMKKTHFK